MLGTMKYWLGKAPSIEEQTTHQPLVPHQLRVGEDVLHFVIPHNFDPDMPLMPLPEAVSLDADRFSGDIVKSQHAWRAWWRFRTPGYFSREIASLGLSIDIFQVYPHFDRDIFVRENFIEAIQINLVNSYAEHNRVIMDGSDDESLLINLPTNPFRSYLTIMHNDQNWIFCGVSSEKGTTNFSRASIPLDERHYLSMTFIEPYQTKFPQLYTATARSVMGWVFDSLFLKRKVDSPNLPSSPEAKALHDPDLWPEMWLANKNKEGGAALPG